MKICSIDGGGIRGLLPALVLADFERRSGKPIGAQCDLLAGTSTGGIIALGLAAGIPAEKLADFYVERGPAIFSRSLKRRLESLGGLADELYDAGELEIALHTLFGDRKLSDVTTDVLVVAYDIEDRETLLFDSRQAKCLPQADYLLADVGRATAAAPTYFEPVIVHSMGGTSHACVDGGVVANNPAMVALTALSYPYNAPPYKFSLVSLLSLGTGRRALPVLLREAKDWGLAGWARPILDIVFNGQSAEVDRQCEEVLGPDRYVRLQPEMPEDLPMDATTAEAYALLRQMARHGLESLEADHALALLGAA